MEKNEKRFLMNLPDSTKVLINQGVYSLYNLKSSSEHGAKFALFAEKDVVFLLSEDGTVISKEPIHPGIEISTPVNFPNLKMPMSLKVNGLAC